MPEGVHSAAELVGRDLEVAHVRAAVHSDRSIVICGEAGVGKTTLARTAIDVTGRRRFEGGGFATLSWMPYLPIARAIGGEPSGDADWVASLVERSVGPDALFIDDLQWADDATVAVLERLIGRIAVVVAQRDGEGADTTVERLAEAGMERLDVHPLSVDDAATLARRTRPGLTGARSRAIAERAGGNAFLVEQLATSGDSEGLRRAVVSRVRELDEPARDMLGMIALADRPLPSDIAGVAADRLIQRGLVVATDSGLAIRHALLADAISAELDEPTQRRLHARLAAMAEAPGERARHLLAAGDRAGAHAAAIEAVARASSAGERAAHLGVAAAAADGPGADRLRIEAAAAMRTAGDLVGATTVLDAVQTRDTEVRGRAEAIRARVCWSSGDADGTRAAVARGLADVGGTGSVSESMLRTERVVVVALVDGQFDEGLNEVEAAIELAERSGADLVRPLLVRATILAAVGRDGWREALEAVLSAARAAGDPEVELSAANNLIAGHEMHGDPAAGRALAERMAGRARDLRLAGWERQFAAMLVNIDLHAGSLAAAVDRAETLLEGPLDPLTAQQVGLAAACALVDMGRFEEAQALLDRLLETASDDVAGRGSVLHIAAEASLWAGRPAEALRRIEEYRAYDGSEHPTSFLVDVTAGWAAIEAGASLPARTASGEPTGMLVGAERERRALEGWSDVDDATTAATFDAAALAYAGYHRRGELRARWAAADARRRDAQVEFARSSLEEIERDADEQGFEPLAGRVRRSLRLLGVRRSAARPSRAEATGGPRLTPREREIVRLISAGASNVEIARRLGIGRPTVARLLSSAMDELGVDSRAQVAARHDTT